MKNIIKTALLITSFSLATNLAASDDNDNAFHPGNNARRQIVGGTYFDSFTGHPHTPAPAALSLLDQQQLRKRAANANAINSIACRTRRWNGTIITL